MSEGTFYTDASGQLHVNGYVDGFVFPDSTVEIKVNWLCTTHIDGDSITYSVPMGTQGRFVRWHDTEDVALIRWEKTFIGVTDMEGGEQSLWTPNHYLKVVEE